MQLLHEDETGNTYGRAENARNVSCKLAAQFQLCSEDAIQDLVSSVLSSMHRN